MGQYVSVVPAYGVLLKTKAEVLEHWNAERDFAERQWACRFVTAP